MNNEPFVLERTFKAPRALVWATFSRAEHLGKWMSPKGMSPGRNFMDFRPGGIFHYEIVPPNQPGFWGRWIYREIVDQELIVNHHSFSDEGGGIVRHPMAPDWPLEMLSKNQFSDVDGGTLLRLEMSVIGSDPLQRQTFEAGRPSMSMGWGGTMDVLDVVLAELQG